MKRILAASTEIGKVGFFYLNHSFNPCLIFTVLIFLFVLGAVQLKAVVRDTKALAALRQLELQEPGVQAFESNERITRLYGKSFGSGNNATSTAEAFRLNHAAVFGVEPGDLKPLSPNKAAQNIQGVMYDRNTGDYKFTLVYYSQFKNEIPVFRSDLRLLVKNDSNYPLVYAASALRGHGNFRYYR